MADTSKGIRCATCDRPVPQPKTSYRLYCRGTDCKALADDMKRLERHLERIADGTSDIPMSAQAQAALRFDLFCQVSLVPRTRDARGRFVSSGRSPEYDALAARRRETREAAERSDQEREAQRQTQVDALMAELDRPPSASSASRARRERSSTPAAPPVRIPLTEDPQLQELDNPTSGTPQVQTSTAERVRRIGRLWGHIGDRQLGDRSGDRS